MNKPVISMKILEDGSDVFSIFHDGTINGYEGSKQKLILIIDCQYLAEKIHVSYNKFYVELHNVFELNFITWSNPIELPSKRLVDLESIFETELTILESKIDQDTIKIVCGQYDLEYDYLGGELFLSFEKIVLYDQNMVEISVEYLDEICNSYWNDFSKNKH